MLEAARRAGQWDEVLDASMDHLTELAGTVRRPTFLTAPRWSRERILRAAFRVLGWRRKPLPPSLLAWRRDG